MDEARPLSESELKLCRWMLEHGLPEAKDFLPQLDEAEVLAWRCPCGCASIKFQIAGRQALPGVHSLSDFDYGDENNCSGVMIYESNGVLSGLEVYHFTGKKFESLPTIEMLRAGICGEP